MLKLEPVVTLRIQIVICLHLLNEHWEKQTSILNSKKYKKKWQ